jgi:hypothetical protein
MCKDSSAGKRNKMDTHVATKNDIIEKHEASSIANTQRADVIEAPACHMQHRVPLLITALKRNTRVPL